MYPFAVMAMSNIMVAWTQMKLFTVVDMCTDGWVVVLEKSVRLRLLKSVAYSKLRTTMPKSKTTMSRNVVGAL